MLRCVSNLVPSIASRDTTWGTRCLALHSGTLRQESDGRGKSASVWYADVIFFSSVLHDETCSLLRWLRQQTGLSLVSLLAVLGLRLEKLKNYFCLSRHPKNVYHHWNRACLVESCLQDYGVTGIIPSRHKHDEWKCLLLFFLKRKKRKGLPEVVLHWRVFPGHGDFELDLEGAGGFLSHCISITMWKKSVSMTLWQYSTWESEPFSHTGVTSITSF